jgi:hypothetical protein
MSRRTTVAFSSSNIFLKSSVVSGVSSRLSVRGWEVSWEGFFDIVDGSCSFMLGQRFLMWDMKVLEADTPRYSWSYSYLSLKQKTNASRIFRAYLTRFLAALKGGFEVAGDYSDGKLIDLLLARVIRRCEKSRPKMYVNTRLCCPLCNFLFFIIIILEGLGYGKTTSSLSFG